jgi:hypothetical protein
MPDNPANTIRGYLDENGGETQVPFHNLLTTWQIEDPGEQERLRIERDLADAELEVDPPLEELGAEDPVSLRITEPEETAAAEEETAASDVEPTAEDELEPQTESALPRKRASSPPPWAFDERLTLAAEGTAPPGAGIARRASHRLWRARNDLIAASLVLLSGAAAAEVGYLLGKGL